MMLSPGHIRSISGVAVFKIENVFVAYVRAGTRVVEVFKGIILKVEGVEPVDYSEITTVPCF